MRPGMCQSWRDLGGLMLTVGLLYLSIFGVAWAVRYFIKACH